MPAGHKVSTSNVKKTYEMLKELLIVYRFKPGGRIGETAWRLLHAAPRGPEPAHVEGFSTIYLVEHAAK